MEFEDVGYLSYSRSFRTIYCITMYFFSDEVN